VRAGEEKEKIGDVVSELGIYGICLFDGRRKEGKRIVLNEEAGHLLRTKGRESDEGGVAVGFSVVDSPFLV
jgi:glutathione synthase